MALVDKSAVESVSTKSATKPSLLKIQNVAKSFGRNAVLRDISLEIA
jgi:ABC-type transporter Mla maintaining outer membrane lipid asymmetry ATPase subunit MlaF